MEAIQLIYRSWFNYDQQVNSTSGNNGSESSSVPNGLLIINRFHCKSFTVSNVNIYQYDLFSEKQVIYCKSCQFQARSFLLCQRSQFCQYLSIWSVQWMLKVSLTILSVLSILKILSILEILSILTVIISPSQSVITSVRHRLSFCWSLSVLTFCHYFILY